MTVFSYFAHWYEMARKPKFQRPHHPFLPGESHLEFAMNDEVAKPFSRLREKVARSAG